MLFTAPALACTRFQSDEWTTPYRHTSESEDEFDLQAHQSDLVELDERYRNAIGTPYAVPGTLPIWKGESIWENYPKRVFTHDRFAQSDKFLLLELALAATDAGNEEVQARLPEKTYIMYPFHDLDYAHVCRASRTYIFAKARKAREQQTLASLKALTGRGLYRCQHLRNVPYDPWDGKRICMFSKHLKGDGIRREIEFVAPFARSPVAKSENISDVWLEGVARVDDGGEVIELGDRAAPVAVKTDRALYLGIEVVWPELSTSCNLDTRSYGKQMIGVDDRKKETHGHSRALQNIFQRILGTMSQPPISASFVASEDGEYHFRKQNESSAILGAPIYECSHFILRNFSEEDEEGIASPLEIKIGHVLTIAYNKLDQCIEPSARQVAHYGRRMQGLVNQAVRSACQAEGGRMAANKCIFD